MLTRTGFVLLFSVVLFSCQKELRFVPPAADHKVLLRFKPVVQFDTEELKFDTVTYQNAFGEDFTVSTFKYYIHDIELVNLDSGRSSGAIDKYFLVDLADTNSAKLELDVPSYKYNYIAFTLGVDSALNVSGAQTDALDPARGMFWTWTTGYIMAKLEGTSPVSTAPANSFMYHIGGFTQAESVIKKIILPLGEEVDMQSGKTTEIQVTADAYAWFNDPHDIRISDHAGVMEAGTLAQQIADNYAKMFMVVKIIND